MESLQNQISLSGRGITRELHSLVIQSPLSGVTDKVFRQIIRKWAPHSLLFTEMVNATSLELGHGSEKISELAEDNIVSDIFNL